MRTARARWVAWAVLGTLAALTIGAGTAGVAGLFGSESSATKPGRTTPVGMSSVIKSWPTPATTATTIPPETTTTSKCSASQLSVHGGRQGGGGAGGANGSIVLTNTSDRACILSGMPSVRLLTANGNALAITTRPPEGGASRAVVVTPSASALLIVDWSNWCGALPGPLDVEIALSGKTESVSGPFNGPPAYDYVPACNNATYSSSLSVVIAYATRP